MPDGNTPDDDTDSNAGNSIGNKTGNGPTDPLAIARSGLVEVQDAAGQDELPRGLLGRLARRRGQHSTPPPEPRAEPQPQLGASVGTTGRSLALDPLAVFADTLGASDPAAMSPAPDPITAAPETAVAQTAAPETGAGTEGVAGAEAGTEAALATTPPAEEPVRADHDLPEPLVQLAAESDEPVPIEARRRGTFTRRGPADEEPDVPPADPEPQWIESFEPEPYEASPMPMAPQPEAPPVAPVLADDAVTGEWSFDDLQATDWSATTAAVEARMPAAGAGAGATQDLSPEVPDSQVTSAPRHDDAGPPHREQRRLDKESSMEPTPLDNHTEAAGTDPGGTSSTAPADGFASPLDLLAGYTSATEAHAREARIQATDDEPEPAATADDETALEAAQQPTTEDAVAPRSRRATAADLWPEPDVDEPDPGAQRADESSHSLWRRRRRGDQARHLGATQVEGDTQQTLDQAEPQTSDREAPVSPVEAAAVTADAAIGETDPVELPEEAVMAEDGQQIESAGDEGAAHQWTAQELADAGWTTADLTAAGWTSLQLAEIGWIGDGPNAPAATDDSAAVADEAPDTTSDATSPDEGPDQPPVAAETPAVLAEPQAEAEAETPADDQAPADQPVDEDDSVGMADETDPTETDPASEDDIAVEVEGPADPVDTTVEDDATDDAAEADDTAPPVATTDRAPADQTDDVESPAESTATVEATDAVDEADPDPGPEQPADPAVGQLPATAESVIPEEVSIDDPPAEPIPPAPTEEPETATLEPQVARDQDPARTDVTQAGQGAPMDISEVDPAEIEAALERGETLASIRARLGKTQPEQVAVEPAVAPTQPAQESAAPSSQHDPYGTQETQQTQDTRETEHADASGGPAGPEGAEDAQDTFEGEQPDHGPDDEADDGEADGDGDPDPTPDPTPDDFPPSDPGADQDGTDDTSSTDSTDSTDSADDVDAADDGEHPTAPPSDERPDDAADHHDDADEADEADEAEDDLVWTSTLEPATSIGRQPVSELPPEPAWDSALPPERTEPESLAATEPTRPVDAAAVPEPLVDTGSGPDEASPDDEVPAFVEYRPSELRRYLLGALFVACAVLAVVAVFYAVQQGTASSIVTAASVTVLAAAFWWGMLSWTPKIISISQGMLEVSHGANAERFDLRDPATEIHVGDKPRSRSWTTEVVRPGGTRLVIHSGQVRPQQFSAIVNHYRSGSLAPEGTTAEAERD